MRKLREGRNVSGWGVIGDGDEAMGVGTDMAMSVVLSNAV